MQVEVRPLPDKKWHGKKDGESFAQPKVLEALYDDATGAYATGLTPEEEKKYSSLLGVNLSKIFSPTEEHPFYSTKAAWVYLQNHTMVFDDSKAMDFIKIKLMKASKFVANSMKEYEEGKFPEATHVIFDEAEEISIKATKVGRKNLAISYLPKMTAQDKINAVMVLSEKSVKNQSADFIDVEMDDIITNKTEEFLALMALGREKATAQARVKEMAQRNILTKEGGSYFYMGELIGMDFDSTVSYFLDPNNQTMKALMLNKLENK